MDPELLAARPLIELVVDGVLGSEEFEDVVEFGVADLHRTVFTDANDSTTVGLAEVVFATKATLAKLDPELVRANNIVMRHDLEVQMAKGGQLLAMAHYPEFNPNTFGSYSRDVWRNRSITDAFEPGSIMKIFTAATAVEKGYFSTKSIFFSRRYSMVFGC